MSGLSVKRYMQILSRETMKFKKIYIEITNICNLNCSFCSKTNKKKQEMTVSEFEYILKKINKYTDYLYLHVKGEPLIHSHLDEILTLTKKYNKKVCITTNGTLLKEKINILAKYDNIYQLNISLHSENNKTNYLEDIFTAVDNLKYPYISYRFWTLEDNKIDERTRKYLDKIKEKYQKKDLYNGIKLANRIYLSLEDKFIWPSIDDNNIKEKGFCYGGKTHLAVLVDGTISICCLDSEGISNLGNIFEEEIEDILNSSKYQKIIEGFNNRKVYLDICKHCKYKERFDK